MMSPCKGCEKRHFKCHADCAEYLEWAAKDRELRQKTKKPLVDYDEERRLKVDRYKYNKRRRRR